MVKSILRTVSVMHVEIDDCDTLQLVFLVGIRRADSRVVEHTKFPWPCPVRHDVHTEVKVYDYPTLYTAGSKRNLREFDIEELLFRKPLAVTNEATNAYYKDKVILITGGGGSIGSELCRQLAKMEPRLIVILDIYENGAYDVQQELKIAYGNNLNLQIEICSITHKKALEKGI